MTGFGVFGWVAGALQLFVPSYGFRLVRRFGTARVGWFLVATFVCLALMHLLVPLRASGPGLPGGFALQLVYVTGSVLLLIGMGHMDALFAERERAGWTEQSLRRKLESELKEQTAELVSAREVLAQELANRDQLTKSLEQSEALYRYLFVENPQPMWVQDVRSCRFLAVNRAALGQYGFTFEEFMALTGRDLVLPSAVVQFLDDAAKSCPAVESRGTWKHCRKDGTLIDVELTTVDVEYAGVPARLVLANDITQKLKRDEQKAKERKLEAVGEISGGIAKHLADSFTVINEQVAALGRQPRDDQSTEELERISDATTRVSGLIRQLLAVGGRQECRLEPLDLNGLVRNLTEMLRRLVGDDIAVERVCGFQLNPVLADRPLVEQVIVSLALNSRDAMPGGGTLSLATSRVCIREKENDGDGRIKPGDYVCLKIRDTGSGMSPEIQSRIFEPFFTTRERDHGMGLGLASVFGIVRQHSGWIEFSSEPGGGTEFRVLLPCAAGSSADSGTLFVKGTILLVEPDDRRRSMAGFILNRNGYRVIEADSSATALVLWAGQASRVDLVLTGTNLPGTLSGPELFQQLQQTRPGLKVIYRSDPEDTANESSSECFTIPNAYSPDILLKAVSSSLES
ncbi:MAG TPA: ATP-binding protein [Verrucomicrobiae bacterium]|nr:ATP-binding protein [Verrucomicrobiae bacterium]